MLGGFETYAQQQNRNPPSNGIASPVTWLPSYPDMIARPPSQSRAPYLSVIVEPLVQLGLADWKPKLPEIIPPVKVPIGLIESFFYIPAISRWGLDADPWYPVYPDFPGRTALQPNVGASQSVGVEFPIPALPSSWLPTYPDFPGRAAPRALDALDEGILSFTNLGSLLIDANTPVTASLTNSVATTLSVVVSTNGPNRLLVVADTFSSDNASATFPVTVSGGGLTWQLQRNDHSTGSFNNLFGTQIWTAWAAAQLTNVTITATTSNTNHMSGIVEVVAFVGADQYPGANAGYVNTSSSQLIQVTLPVSQGSLIVGAFNDNNGSPTLAPISTTVFDATVSDPAAPTGIATGRSTHPSTAQGLVTVGATTNTQFTSASAIEIRLPVLPGNLGWYPSYPEFARAPKPINVGDLTEFAYVPAINTWGIDEGKSPWLPDYPDFPGRKQQPLNAESLTQTAYVPAINTWGIDEGKSPWLPDYPDFPGRTKLPINSESLTEFAYVPAVNRWGIDSGKVPWLPDYPDFPARILPQPNVTSTQFAYVPAVNRWGLDSGKVPWLPDFPDFPGRTNLPLNPTALSQFVSIELPIAPQVGDTRWEPIYPDFPGRKQQPINVGDLTEFAFEPVLSKFPIGNTVPWLPDFPDFPGRRQQPLNVGDLTEFAYVPAINRWGLDAIPWLPDYPDFPSRAQQPLNVEILTQFAYTPAVTRWGIDNGEMPWLSDYPDFARVAPDGNKWLGVVSHNLTSQVFPIGPTIPWLPDYPDFPARGPRPINTGDLTEYKHVLLISYEPHPNHAAIWLPDYPDFPGRKAPDINVELGTFSFRDDLVPKLIRMIGDGRAVATSTDVGTSRTTNPPIDSDTQSTEVGTPITTVVNVKKRY